MNEKDNKKIRMRRASAAFYAIIAVCIIAVGAAALSTVENERQKAMEETKPASSQIVSERVSDTPSPDIFEAPENRESKETTEKNTADTTDTLRASKDVSSENVSADNSTPSQKKYTRPVSGSLLTPHSGDELVYSKTLDDWRVHHGCDYKAAPGEAVRAIADGKVTKVYTDDLMGHCVEVEHDGSLTSVYMGLAPEISVKEGQSVKMGDTLGGVGESALSESALEPHIHLEVMKGGKQTDPESLFK